MLLNLYIILGFLAVFLVLFEWNMRVYRRFDAGEPREFPKVSVLVPCRNEAARLEENLEGLLRQDYPDFEVLALNDGSTDRTGEILERAAARDARLKVLEGEPLPEGWQGKNFACHQLRQKASGEWLLFADADTRHRPETLRRAVRTVERRRAALLSTFPRQVCASAGDELVVPLMFFVVLSYLPMFFVARRTWKWAGDFVAACGQFLFVRADAYDRVGGHRAIAGRVSEAPILAKAVKDRGERILLLDGSPWVSCRMYEGLAEAFRGFRRSLFATMGGSVTAMIFFLVLQTYLYIVPWILLVMALAGGAPDGRVAACLAAALAAPFWVRWRIHRRIGLSTRRIWAHPVSIALYHWIMIASFIDYRVRRRTVWKDRAYAAPRT